METPAAVWMEEMCRARASGVRGVWVIPLSLLAQGSCSMKREVFPRSESWHFLNTQALETFIGNPFCLPSSPGSQEKDSLMCAFQIPSPWRGVHHILTLTRPPL